MKGEIWCEVYKKCLENNKIILRSLQNFRSQVHIVFTEALKKIAFSTNDGKRLLALYWQTSHSYDTSTGTVCKIELIEYLKMKIWIQ